MERGSTEPALQRSDFSLNLQHSYTLPLNPERENYRESISKDVVIISPRECISDGEGSFDSDFISSLRQSISSTRSSLVNSNGSVFTPVRKRERSVSLSPIGSVKKSLRFDSSNTASPFISRNTSSILDEYDTLSLTTTQDLVVLDNCPTVFSSYEKDFVTLKRLGEGNFTYVDLVQCVSNKTMYAIKRSKAKMVKPSERRHFLREIRLFSAVHSCPNLVQYYKSWQEDAVLYTLMEYCPRGDLSAALRLAAPMPEPVVWFVLLSVLQTLQCLHAEQIVHCDIKPENLFLTESGALRVGDLGCATRCDDVGDVSDLRYIALEGLEDEFSPRRDIFSLGLVVFQLMSKEDLPVSGDRWRELRHGGVQTVEGYSRELNAMVQEMTALEHRPSATDLLARIPESVANNEADARLWIRANMPSTTSSLKKKKQLTVKTSFRAGEAVDRSDMTTPVDVIQNAYTTKFSF